MDLNSVALFAKVVKTGSFTGASKLLNLPKSTVSTKISELERQLGVLLLRRTTRKISLTEAGQAFLERANDALHLLQQAESEVTHGQTSALGKLKVTAPVELGSNILGPVLIQLSKDFPDVSVELMLTDRIVDLVGEGYDIGIRAGQLEDSSLRAKKLGESGFQLYASPRYLKENTPLKSIKDLENHKCINFSTLSPDGAWEMKKGNETRSIQTRGSLTVNHLVVLKELVMSGMGIGLIPGFMVTDEIQKNKLTAILPEWTSDRAPIHAVFPPGKYTTPKVEAFIATLTKELKRIF